MFTFKGINEHLAANHKGQFLALAFNSSFVYCLSSGFGFLSLAKTNVLSSTYSGTFPFFFIFKTCK